MQKGYRARKGVNRAKIKKRRVNDDNFRKSENEIRLERFNDDCEIPSFQIKHKENQSHLRMLLKDPDKRAEYNMQQLQALRERLKDSDKRAAHNKQQVQVMTDRLKDPSIRDRHNSYVLENYRANKRDVEPITLNYFFQISQGPTFVCCCCGCLHFRRSVVVLTKTRLDSTSDTTFINQVYYNLIISFLI